MVCNNSQLGVEMFSKSEIMRDAWAMWREKRARYAAWQFERGIHDGSFSTCLRTAWAKAKRARDNAERRAKVERILSGPKGLTLIEMQRALEAVDYLPSHMNASRRRASITAQIEALIQEAA